MIIPAQPILRFMGYTEVLTCDICSWNLFLLTSKSIIMKTFKVPVSSFLAASAPVYLLLFVLLLQGCNKKETANSLSNRADPGALAKKRNPPPPPPPPTFFFVDCYNPTYSASFQVGIAANKTITKNYLNSPGDSYSAFSSTSN